MKKGSVIGLCLISAGLGFVIGREMMRQQKDVEYEHERRLLKGQEAALKKLREDVKEGKKASKELKDLKDYHKIVKNRYISDEEEEETPPPFVNKEVDDDGEVTYKAKHVREDGDVVGVSISPSLFEKSLDEPYLMHRIAWKTEEDDKYEKDFFTLYSGDNTLCDDHDEVVTNEDLLRPVKTFDPMLLNCFGYLEDEPDVILIRNETLMIDYEVTRLDASYNEAVLGLGSESYA